MPRAFHSLVFVLLYFTFAVTTVTSADSQGVRELTDGDFDQYTAEGVWLVEFFAPW